jgi:hypothetical protein
MSRQTRSMLMLAFSAVAFVTLGRVTRPVSPRFRDAQVVVMTETEAGH